MERGGGEVGRREEGNEGGPKEGEGRWGGGKDGGSNWFLVLGGVTGDNYTLGTRWVWLVGVASHLTVQEVEELPVCEDEEGRSCQGVDDRQPMNLVLHQHLHSVIETAQTNKSFS